MTATTMMTQTASATCYPERTPIYADLEHHDLDHGDGHRRVLPGRCQALGEHVNELLVQLGVASSQNLDVLRGELERCSLHRELCSKTKTAPAFMQHQQQQRGRSTNTEFSHQAGVFDRGLAASRLRVFLGFALQQSYSYVHRSGTV